jgi:Bacterial conjugation TrbI-like protein
MKQFIQDQLFVLKESRKAKFIALFAVLAIAFLMFYEKPNSANRLVRPADDLANTGGQRASFSTGPSEGDIINTFNNELEQLRKSSEKAREQIDTQNKQMELFQDRTTKIFRKILDRVSETEQRIDEAVARGGQPNSGSENYPSTVTIDEELPNEDPAKAELKSWGNLEEPEPAPPPTPAPPRYAHVSAGDSVRIKLLAGVNAPTNGSPYPVLFKLSGNVNGPDNTKLPLGGARLIAAAQGSLVDARVLFRLVSLNINLPNGQRQTIPVDGWVVGEDGIRGMSGIPIDPLGSAIAGFTLTGAINGLGLSLQQSNLSTQVNGAGGVTQALTGDTAEFAAGAGISGGAREWQNLLTQRLRDLVPVVQVYSGREATAIFNRDFNIQNLYDQLVGDEYGEESWD